MKNLTKKIAPLVLAGAGAWLIGIVGCATNPPAKIPTPIVSPSKINNRWFDLKNGFLAESYKVHDNILLLTENYLGESILIKTGENYEGVKTEKYHTTPTEKFDKTYDKFCEAIDNGGDKFITEIETLFFIDGVYKSMEKIIWLEDE